MADRLSPPLPVTLQGFAPWAAERVWYVPLGSPPRWCRVGQQYALYNPLNGATHFLQESAYETVQALVQQPMTMTALMACLGLDEAREEAEAQVVQSGLLRLLWELDNLGIIAPLPC